MSRCVQPTDAACSAAAWHAVLMAALMRVRCQLWRRRSPLVYGASCGWSARGFTNGECEPTPSRPRVRTNRPHPTRTRLPRMPQAPRRTAARRPECRLIDHRVRTAARCGKKRVERRRIRCVQLPSAVSAPPPPPPCRRSHLDLAGAVAADAHARHAGDVGLFRQHLNTAVNPPGRALAASKKKRASLRRAPRLRRDPPAFPKTAGATH